VSLDLQTRIVRELRDFFAGIRAIVSDPYARRGLLDQLGLRPDAEPPPEASWQALDRMDAVLGETSPTWEQRRAAIDEILVLAGVMEDFVAAARAEDSEAEIFGDVAVEALELCSLSYIRTRYPLLAAIARFLGFLEDFGTTYKLEGYRRDRWSQFWTAFHDWFTDWYNGHPLTTGTPASSGSALVVLTDIGMIAGAAAYFSRHDRRWFYSWDPAPGSTTPNLDVLSERALTFELPLTGKKETGKVDLRVPITVMFVPSRDGGPGIFVSAGASASDTIEVGAWKVGIELSSADGVDLALVWGTPAALPPREGRLRLFAEWTDPGGGQVVIGDPAGTRIEFRSLLIEAIGSVDGAGGEFRASAGIKAVIRAGALVVRGLPLAANSELRVAIDSDLGLAIDTEQGLHLVGSAGLIVTIPFGQPIPGIQVPFLEAGLVAAAKDGKTELTAHLAAAITINTKAFKLTLDRIGYRWRLTGVGDDGIRWPTGIGVAIELGPVSGGGYLFRDEGRGLFGGALQLAIGKLSISAYGIAQKIDERWSFVVFLGLEFTPVPLFLGLTLNGVGGLWARDRTVDVDAIADGLKSRVLDDLLFPRDIVVNASRLMNTVTRVFPPAPGQNVLGPMLKLGFGTPNVATLAIGLLFEWPDPSRTIVVGTIQSALPSAKAAVAHFVLDVIGWWDHSRDESEIYGILRDSKLASFKLQGSGAVRTRGGEDPFWGISIGGFHPSYTPPVAFRPMDRVSLDLTGRDNPRLRFEGYFAWTSNSFQAGGKVEALVRKAGFSLEGQLALDVLITDGSYEFDLSVTLALKRGASTICGLHFEGVCTGGSPFQIRGKASISFLFFTVTFPVSYRSAGDAPGPLPASDPTEAVLAALRDRRSWGSELPGKVDQIVLVRPAQSDTVRVHPLGRITLTQNVVPLGVEITRFGPSRPSAARTFTLGGFTANGRTLDAAPIASDFAPGQFFDLSDDEQLSRPSFEKMTAGVALGSSAVVAGEEVVADLAYETIILDVETGRRRALGASSFAGAVMRTAVATGAGTVAPRRARGDVRWASAAVGVTVLDPRYHVVDDALAATGRATTYTEALAAVRARPGARLRVIGAHERTR
jgi:hypothetical protein